MTLRTVIREQAVADTQSLWVINEIDYRHCAEASENGTVFGFGCSDFFLILINLRPIAQAGERSQTGVNGQDKSR